MKKLIESDYFLIPLIIFVLIIPENSGSIIPSIPIDNFFELCLLLFTLFICFKFKNSKKQLYILLFFILILKIILITQPSNMWKLCYQDDIAERFYEEIGQTVDNQFACEKLYFFNVGSYSSLENNINFFSNPDFEWLGANGSNFDLGFFNNKKFNFKSNESLDRKWLPFELEISKDFKNENNSMRIIYVGEIEIYKNSEIIYQGKSYLNEKRIELNNVGNSNIKINYKFEKSEGNEVRIKAEYPRNYPPDKYGRIQILDSNNNLLNAEKSIITLCSELIFILIILYFIFLICKKFSIISFKKYFYQKKLLILFYVFLLYLIFAPDVISMFPVLIIVDSFTIFLYLAAISVFYFYNLKPFEIFLVTFAITFLLMDLDYKLFNEYIRPGGSDSLTYEYFSRLILEGRFLQGGEDVYTYSPGARYFIFFFHVFFGERLKFVFIALNAFAAFLLITNKSYKFDKGNVFSYFAFIYLTSNAINRIFIFGMSEIFSLILILLYLKSDKLKSQFPTISGLILGLVLINRPILALGILFIAFLSRNLKTISSFMIVSILPFFHNLFYGKKFTVFTGDWNYQGDVLDENLSIEEQILQTGETIMTNFHYVTMNPLYPDVYSRVGRMLPLIVLISICYFFYILFKNKKFLNNSVFINLLPVLLFVAPFAIYDPIFFYPRFLLIPHIVFFDYCKNLKNEYS